MPEGGEMEIVLRVEAFGPNRAETMFRRGGYPQYAPELPSALGYEASGTVIAVGPGDVCEGRRTREHDPVVQDGRYWTYGEVARVPEYAAAFSRAPQSPSRSLQKSRKCWDWTPRR